MQRSEKWNNLQICPCRDSNSGRSDLWSNALPVRPWRPHNQNSCYIFPTILPYRSKSDARLDTDLCYNPSRSITEARIDFGETDVADNRINSTVPQDIQTTNKYPSCLFISQLLVRCSVYYVSLSNQLWRFSGHRSNHRNDRNIMQLNSGSSR